MGEAYSTHDKNENCIQNFRRKILREESIREIQVYVVD
jgi:hypothetical protein